MLALSRDGTTVRLTEIRPGRTEQAVDRLEAMRTIVVDAMLDPTVPEWARIICADADGHSPPALAAAIHAWLVAHVKFMPDPLGWRDFFDTPAYMLETIATNGDICIDCDDAAILAAALGTAVGIPARFVAVAFAGDADRIFRHVWAELSIAPGFAAVVNCDVTRPPGVTMPAIGDTLAREI